MDARWEDIANLVERLDGATLTLLLIPRRREEVAPDKHENKFKTLNSLSFSALMTSIVRSTTSCAL